MFNLSWMIFMAALVGVGALMGDHIRVGRTLSRLRSRNEALGDDVWEYEAAMEARRRAEAASEAKSRFLATVSHEIRTPLNGILGIVDLLHGTPLDREQLAYMEALKTSGQALATLIDEILDFSRIEAGKLVLGAEPFDLSLLMEGVVELLAPRAQDKGIEIAAFVDPALPRRIVGDPVRLRQVLTNLAGNAVKFTDEGGVGLRVDRLEDGLLRFSVSDTGPGVPFDRRHAIFEEFEQADGTTTRRHGGTGLGLAISRRIVDRMGSALGLQDRPGGGSIFGFDVRLDASQDAEDKSVSKPIRLDERRALIAAHSTFQAPFLAARLESMGAAVGSLTEEAAILGHLQGRPASDLVFIDCALGQAVAERLRDAARQAGARQIFLLFSPYERRAFGQKLVEGFDGWLVKPVRAKSLAARLAGETPAPVRRTLDHDVIQKPVPAFRHHASGQEPLPAGGRPTPRVLLAEDNEINALVAMNYLGRLGAQAVHASNGRSALDLALSAMRGETPRFDAILMDVSMPELDGLEVARRLRIAEAKGNFGRTRIVALTAHAFAEDRTAFLQAGMDDVLIKPIDFVRFSAALAPRETLQQAG